MLLLSVSVVGDPLDTVAMAFIHKGEELRPEAVILANRPTASYQ